MRQRRPHKFKAPLAPAITIFLVLRPDVDGLDLQFRFKDQNSLFLTKTQVPCKSPPLSLVFLCFRIDSNTLFCPNCQHILTIHFSLVCYTSRRPLPTSLCLLMKFHFYLCIPQRVDLGWAGITLCS